MISGPSSRECSTTLRRLRGPVQNFVQFVPVRKGHAQFEKETIELRLRQRICAFHLERVLRGDYQKGFSQQVRDPSCRHLLFLHRLEQRRLSLRRGPIDLVGQQEVRKERTRLKA